MGIKGKKIEDLTIEDIAPLSLSFKKTERDLEIYKYILSHSSYSNYIKDTIEADKILKEEMKNSKKKKTNIIPF